MSSREEETDVERRLRTIALYGQLLHTITTQLHAEIVSAVAAGVSRRRIAIEAGTSERSVRRWAKSCPATESDPEPTTGELALTSHYPPRSGAALAGAETSGQGLVTIPDAHRS